MVNMVNFMCIEQFFKKLMEKGNNLTLLYIGMSLQLSRDFILFATKSETYPWKFIGKRKKPLRENG